MEQSGPKPWMKYIVAGGVFCGEGGSLLAFGLIVLGVINMMNQLGSQPGTTPQCTSFGQSVPCSVTSNAFLSIAITLTIIGATSLVIGLFLINKGKFVKENYTSSRPAIIEPKSMTMGKPKQKECPYCKTLNDEDDYYCVHCHNMIEE
ncbi:MAG TPA: hypothetical protein VKM55_19070 [Candidatus Lokiarchaeia archaeon]|nr:hypothetical protein [Candidatus Lokiarchaeia archaeon]